MGLKAGDLIDLVSPIISIDEYESKIDEDAIVVALFLKFKEPADDLNKFIQKVGQDIIDTDVSPSVTENGDYVVFVEMYRNSEFIEDLLLLMKYVGDLTNIDEWEFTYYKTNGVFELNEEELKKHVRLENKETADILEFFNNSMIDGIIINENSFSVVKNKKIKTYELVGFKNEIETIIIPESKLNSIYELQNIFGNIDVELIKEGISFYNGLKYMVVKEI